MNTNIFKYIIITVSFCSLMACQKVLELTPTTAIDGETAVTDSVSVERSMLGIYSGLQNGNYYGLRYLYYQDVYADNLSHSGTFSTDQEVSNRRINPTNSQIANTWGSIYDVINRCNIVIAKIKNVTFTTATTSNRYIAEARFLRALAYYDLLRVFGGVPLQTEATIRIEDIKNLPRSTESQVYDQIIADLLFAETNLTNSTGLAGTATGLGVRPNRASSLSATALLARVYLQRGDNANAFIKANAVIISGQYTMQASFADIFNREKTTECILDLDFTLNDQNTLASSSDATTSGQRFYLRAALNSLFVVGDLRSVASRRTVGTRNTIVKYFRISSGDDNVPLIRVAEMYMIRAEANARLGVSTDVPIAQVLSDINVIRNRAGLTSVTAVTTPTNAAALTEILNQRRLEFAFEGHRFADMKRYGTATTLFPAAEAYRVLWPIPFTQIENTGRALTQNPGY